MTMLYRALYLHGTRIRGLTFAASSAAAAAQVAAQWQQGDTLLSVAAIRPLQPELELT